MDAPMHEVDGVDAAQPQLIDQPQQPDAQPVLVEQDLLVEDVCIDGMCGVY